MQIESDPRLREAELASRLPEYGTEAIANLTEEDLYVLGQIVLVEQTARTCARMCDDDVTDRHREQIRHSHGYPAAA